MTNQPDILSALRIVAQDDPEARLVLADRLEELGDLHQAGILRDPRTAPMLAQHVPAPSAFFDNTDRQAHERPEVMHLWRDELPMLAIPKRTRIDAMTPQEYARMSEWKNRWVQNALQTGPADRSLFEAGVSAIYRYCGFEQPTVIWTPAPIVPPLAGPIAAWMIFGDSAVSSAVRSAVSSAVRSAVRSAVSSAPKLGEVWQKIQWQYQGGQFWPGWYWGPAYVSFMLDVMGLDIGRDLELKARAFQAVCQSQCYWWPNQKFVIASERPTLIEPGKRARWEWVDEQGQPQFWEATF